MTDADDALPKGRRMVDAQASLIERMAALCGGEFEININAHRSCYTKLEDHIELLHISEADLPPEMEAEILAKQHIVEVRAYPRTPIVFIHIVDHDLQRALERCDAALWEELHDLTEDPYIQVRDMAKSAGGKMTEGDGDG